MAYPRREHTGRGGSSPCSCAPDQAQKLTMNRLITDDNMTFAEHILAPLKVGGEAACLAHHENAGRHVPGRKVALPKAVEPAGGDPGEIEGGGSETTQARDLLLNRGEFLPEQHQIAAAVVRQPARHDGIDQSSPRCYAQALIVEESALAALGGEQLLVGRVVDDTGHDRPLALERDGDGELRDAVQEVGRAVKRVHDPRVGLVGALAPAAFLAEETVARAR